VHSPTSGRRCSPWLRLPIALAILVVMLVLAAAVPMKSASTDASQPSDEEITRALDGVKADPNLAALQTIKMLRWKDRDAPKPSTTPEWLKWIAELFRWFDQSARFLVWGVVALLAILLMGYVASFVSRRGAVTVRDPGIVAPSRVFDLDIRPESLPDDIGAAARLLWDRSEHRAALALLYRGMLSRLAHVHQVPIRDSSTEGDCLDLAVQHLPPTRSEYASRLIGAWQRAIYGREDIRTDLVYRLCDGFSSALDRTSPLGAGPGTAA
jgi:Domain of unknown function (DUF4129)